jgi:hypothetical protein
VKSSDIFKKEFVFSSIFRKNLEIGKTLIVSENAFGNNAAH